MSEAIFSQSFVRRCFEEFSRDSNVSNKDKLHQRSKVEINCDVLCVKSILGDKNEVIKRWKNQSKRAGLDSDNADNGCASCPWY